MKKQAYKRAVEIAADIMSRMDCCVVGDTEDCPAYREGGAPEDCVRCIGAFLRRKARQELRREKEGQR